MRRSSTDHDPIRCEEVVTHLLEYLDGETAADRRGRIGRHLDECRDCCSRLDFEKALRKKVAELGDEKASPSLRRRLKAVIDDF